MNINSSMVYRRDTSDFLLDVCSVIQHVQDKVISTFRLVVFAVCSLQCIPNVLYTINVINISFFFSF